MSSVRELGEAQYQAAKRRLASGAQPVTPAAPVSLADKPDADCIDVRGLSDQGYRAAKAGMLQRAATTTRPAPAGLKTGRTTP